MERTEWRETIETDVGARLDRLPWARWHWFVVAALGLVWLLDGLEATIVGSVAARLTEEEALNLTSAKVGIAASIYIAGAAIGALLFGFLNDRIGRRRVFLITLSLYLLGTLATASAFSFWSFAMFRFFTGMGIGGEYVAINATIGELVPARVRGWVYVAVNGSWWLGATAGAGLSVLLLEPGLLPADLGWRLAFVGGAVLGIGILVVRRHLPESPRWLAIHGYAGYADRIVSDIEERIGVDGRPEGDGAVCVRQRKGTAVQEVLRTLVRRYPRRAGLAFSLMVGQAFFYNAIFYTHGIVLTDFYDVTSDDVGIYLAPLALGNFLGALLLGRFFDTRGRRIMLTLTYIASSLLLAGTALLFWADALTLFFQTLAWASVFFFASAAASAAYLTISEIWPVEVRGLGFAVFYALSTGAGGVSGPALFGLLVSDESRLGIVIGYFVGAGLMFVGGLVALWLALDAERRPLEEVAPPLGSREQSDQPPAAEKIATSVP